MCRCWCGQWHGLSTQGNGNIYAEVCDVCTSCIGYRGVGDVQKVRVQEASESEFRLNPANCGYWLLSAFEPWSDRLTGKCRSTSPWFVTSIRTSSSKSTSCAIAKLRKEQSNFSMEDKVREKKRQPPDMSVVLHTMCGKYHPKYSPTHPYKVYSTGFVYIVAIV